MASPYLSQITMFGGNFAPKNYALCNGQLLSIQQNAALFSLIGTTYGGNGVNNFALPNLQSALPLGFGKGAGLSPYVLGQNGGVTVRHVDVADGAVAPALHDGDEARPPTPRRSRPPCCPARRLSRAPPYMPIRRNLASRRSYRSRWRRRRARPWATTSRIPI